MHLHDKNIFILGLNKYDDNIESTIFNIAKYLAKDNHVFYIENPFTWKDFIFGNSKKEIKRRRKYFAYDCDEVIDTGTPNLKVIVTPPLISINWLPESRLYRAILKINERIIRHRIWQVIKKFCVSNYLFINSYNFYYPDLGRLLTPDLVVYHSVDPIVFSIDRKHGLVSERKIIEESNLVICTSKKLYDEKIKFNKNTFFIPNAADIKHSNKALQPGLAIHECLKNIQGPIVGYFGTIERRFDYDLLNTVIDENRNLNFVFCGPVNKEWVPDWFYGRPNIYLPGPIPYEQMPQVLKGFDVAIIPFKKDEFSSTIFPLKLFEYLGSGRPVVVTDFNLDLEDFTGSTVNYCKDAQSFSAAIRKSINDDSEQLMQNRLVIAKQNTWEKRVEEFTELINHYMPENKEGEEFANAKNGICLSEIAKF